MKFVEARDFAEVQPDSTLKFVARDVARNKTGGGGAHDVAWFKNVEVVDMIFPSMFRIIYSRQLKYYAIHKLSNGVDVPCKNLPMILICIEGTGN